MDYKQVYKNTGTTPRTIGQAYNTAEYASAIHTYKSEHVSAMRMLGFLVGVSVIFLLAVFVATAVLTWFGVVVW